MTAATVKSVCPYCGVGCGIVMEVSGNRVVKVSGDKSHPANHGRLCTKGSTCGQSIAETGRMDKAYVRPHGASDQAPVAIDVAIDETAKRLRTILEADGPDAIAFYVSGQMSLEAQYLANKLAKGFIRTKHIESNSRLCMASAGSGYKLSLGADGPPGSYQDFDRADLFFVIGANMADCHPILFLRMMDRVKAGAKLIVVDPRRTATADKASLFLQIKPGSDLALLNGLLHLIVKNGHHDADFIAKYTEGWDAMPGFLDDYAPEKVAQITGLPEADIRQAAQWLGEAPEWMSCWTMGLNQSTHGTWNTNAICNLHLATGKICRPGSGPFSLTGQPNAMGGREMGYMGPGLPGQRSALVDADRVFIEEMWGLARGTLRAETGGGTVSMFEDMQAGRIKACWIICTNPVATAPNRKNVIAGLQAADLVITQDAFLDTETNIYADIMLPGALWAEAEGVMINSERNITLMQKAVDAPGDALADWRIIAEVACKMGYADAFSYASAEDVFDEIKAAWNPKTGYDIRGASHDRLRQTPLQWPCAPDAPSGRNPIRYLNNGVSQTLLRQPDGVQPDLVFPTESGKAIFLPRPHMAPAEMPDPHFPFVLNTGRLQHQWHTLTKTGKIATLNKLNPGPFVEIHPEDASILGVVDKDRIEIRSRRGKAILPAVVTDRVRPGNCFAPFHWNDVFGDDLAINAVTSDAVDPISLQPEFKFCAVALTRVAEERPPRPKIERNDRELAAPRASAAANDIEDSDMRRINALASLLNLDKAPDIILGANERLYMQGYLAGLGMDAPRHADGVPVLPPTAPIEPSKRLTLDGILAGLFSRSPLPDDRRQAIALPEPDINQKASTQRSVTILWASQTGNAEAYASECAGILKAEGYAAKAEGMDAFNPKDLPNVSTLLVLASTFGDGDPPDNGAAFWNALQTDQGLKLNDTRFAVLAFGDSNYDQFCEFGRKLDARLEALGAQRMTARMDCEPEFQETAKTWLHAIVQALAGADAAAKQPIFADAGDMDVSAPLKPPAPEPPAYSRKHPLRARLSLNRVLNAKGAEKETRHIAFDLSGEGFTYQAGDALGVWPTNSPELTDGILSALKLSPTTEALVKDRGAMPLRDALLRHYEIAKIAPELLQFVRERSGNDFLAGLLTEDHAAELKRWLWGRQVIDLLRAFPIEATAQEWLSVLKPLQPRLYSIASSPKTHPGEVHLTVSTVRYSFDGESRGGVCSTFLADRAINAGVPIFVQKSAHFHPPKNSDSPMIMIGPGTGIAPFRAFLQERRATGAKGKNWIFFGEQHADKDFYYREELETARRDGYLHRLETAFSRDQEEKVYVQHRMVEQGAMLWRWLQDGAYFYVCGNASHMAKDVESALRQVARTHGGLNNDDAEAYVARMAREKRYLRDVY